MSKTRRFQGIWIPKEIWLSEDLTTQEKLFLVEIDSLDNEEGCYASNKHFANFFDLSKGRCSQIIKSLKDKGFVTAEYDREESGKVNKRTLRITDKVFNMLKGGIKNPKEGYLENAKENNTSNNNTKYNYGDSEKYEPDNHRISYTSFVDAFNELYDKNRRVTESKKKNIRSRLRTFTGQEIKQAWENRLKDDWLNGEGSEYMGNWKASMRNDEKIDNYLNAENNSDDSHLFDNNKMRKINAGH